MKYFLFTIFLGSWLVPAFAAESTDPLQPFSAITQSNMFDPNRGLPRPIRTAGGTTEAPVTVPTATLTLAGVGILRGEITAVFTGSSTELTGIHRAGDRIADLSLAAVDLEGATLMLGEVKLRLPVGSALVKTADTPWQVSTVAPAAASTVTTDSPAAAAGTDSAGADSNDILRRMRERRQKEMNP